MTERKVIREALVEATTATLERLSENSSQAIRRVLVAAAAAKINESRTDASQAKEFRLKTGYQFRRGNYRNSVAINNAVGIERDVIVFTAISRKRLQKRQQLVDLGGGGALPTNKENELRGEGTIYEDNYEARASEEYLSPKDNEET